MTTPQPRIATTRVVTEINRTAILDALLEHGPLSRKQIVQRTGLSSATVERLSAALLSENLIAVDGLERSSGGRPSYLLRYAGSSRAVAAIEVSETAVRGRLVDFDGASVAEEAGPCASRAPSRWSRRSWRPRRSRAASARASESRCPASCTRAA